MANRLTDSAVATVLVLGCRTCGHWLTAHRVGNSPDTRPIFFCVGDDSPASADHGTCERCPESAPVRFGNLVMGTSAQWSDEVGEAK